MERKINMRLQKLIFAALFAALVFVMSGARATFGADGTAIHLGNSMCILAGLMLGGVYGGAAAGIGSMLYDFTNPLYIASAPITLVNKFMMGFVAGILNTKLKIKNALIRALTAAIAGQTTYILLYMAKTFADNILIGNDPKTAFVMLGAKAVTSVINGIIAVSVSVPLYLMPKKV
ncbi:MAG: ECF transporter S component [Oscillospiraceae bacterium]|jgi:uncharacterized membrane protein|nr:ECF transporter S component [Oscillospiraceae bacterium]